jgi:hypothetical protein
MMDRMSHLLRQHAGLSPSYKHRLMCHVADTLDQVEYTLEAISLALERGDMGVVRLRLKHIEKLLGCEQVVMDDDTDEYRSNTKCETSNNGN